MLQTTQEVGDYQHANSLTGFCRTFQTDQISVSLVKTTYACHTLRNGIPFRVMHSNALDILTRLILWRFYIFIFEEASDQPAAKR